LRNAAVISDVNFRKAQNQNVLPDPAMIANDQFPRVCNVYTRTNDNACSNRCTKPPQQPNTKTRRQRKMKLKTKCLHDHPKQLFDSTCTAVKVSVIELIQMNA
jgi:hypothetical protein